MREELQRIANTATSPLQARNLAREYLQALILQSMPARWCNGDAGLSRRNGATVSLRVAALTPKTWILPSSAIQNVTIFQPF